MKTIIAAVIVALAITAHAVIVRSHDERIPTLQIREQGAHA